MTAKTINRAYEATVQAIFKEVMGSDFIALRPNPSYPDSIVYTGVGNTQSLVFKMMDPAGRDPDRIAAEAWAITQAQTAGIPTPTVVKLDTSCTDLPATYMLMEHAQGSDLRAPQLEGAERQHYLRQIGAMLRRLHSVEVTGYGRLESDTDGSVRGFADTWRDGALDAFETGLRVLQDNDLLPDAYVQRATKIVTAHEALLATNHNRLLHGDVGLIHVFADLDTRKVTGLIDFGECKSGDPVWDFVDFRLKDVPAIREGYAPDADMQTTFSERFALYGILRNLIWAVRWYDVWPEAVGEHLRDWIDFATKEFKLTN